MALGEKDLRERLAVNLTALRKKAGLTQSELAERINYSDKSVSKWERGDGVPELFVLYQLCEIYGVKLDDFLSESADSIKMVKKASPLTRRSKLIITALAVGLVWLAATIVHFILGLTSIPETFSSLVYYCAIPITAIVLIVFTAMWFPKIFSALSVSALIWSVAYGIHLYIPTSGITGIYQIAVVLQILVLLWYLLLFLINRNRKKHEKQGD